MKLRFTIDDLRLRLAEVLLLGTVMGGAMLCTWSQGVRSEGEEIRVGFTNVPPQVVVEWSGDLTNWMDYIVMGHCMGTQRWDIEFGAPREKVGYWRWREVQILTTETQRTQSEVGRITAER